jgi:hypothetical protein
MKELITLRATKEKLCEIHKDLHRVIQETISHGTLTRDRKTGKEIMKVPTAAFYEVARKFMLDNSIGLKGMKTTSTLSGFYNVDLNNNTSNKQ